MTDHIHDLALPRPDGGTPPPADSSGPAVRLENPAGECGLTPQCAGQERLRRGIRRSFRAAGADCA